MIDVDPSTLTDEELDRAIAGEEIDPPASDDGGTPPPTDEEAEQTPPAADPAPDTPPADPPATEPEVVEDDPKPPSRREQLRVQQLLNKMSQPARPQTTVTPQSAPGGLNYSEELDADAETIQRLEADRSAAIARAQQDSAVQIQSSEWRTMLNIDAPQVESKYDFLNPKDAEKFHPVLADTLSNWYLQTSQFDAQTGNVGSPQMRWGEFVDGIYELAEEIAATKIQTATKNITRQAANTGIRPDGSAAKKLNLNQAPQDMSDDELDAFLAQSFPSK